MYSFPGEPGFAALYLLYGFSLALPLALMSNQQVMDRTQAGYASLILGACLVLTTSTTAYGGVVILAGFFGIAAYRAEWVSRQLVTRVIGVGVLGVGLVFVLGLLIPSLGIASAIVFQSEKLMFGAGSGSLRIRYIVWSVSLGASNILGVGVGSHYGKSLIGSVFAETGFMGLITSSGAILSCGWLVVQTQTTEGRAIGLSTAVVFGTSALAKGVSVLLFSPMWLAIALPIIVGSSWTSIQPVAVGTTGLDDRSVVGE